MPGDTLLSQDHHNTNQSNEIVSRELDSTTRGFVYEASGNLIFDGLHHFRYDTWNRLVEIHEPGTLSVDSAGSLSGTVGTQVESFEYDAVNRKVRSGPSNLRFVYGTGAAARASDRRRNNVV